MKHIQVSCFIFMVILLALSPAFAEGPGRGSLSKSVVSVHNTLGDCVLQDVDVKWNLDSLLGDVTIWGSYQFMDNSQCPQWKDFTNIVVWLKLAHGGGHGFVEISHALKPEEPGKWAWDPLPYSTDWEKTLCGFQGTERKTSDCFPAKIAKTHWKNGQITDFVMTAKGFGNESSASAGSDTGSQSSESARKGSHSSPHSPYISGGVIYRD